MSFTPRGNPLRVIEYLRTLPVGAEATTAVICDTLDIDHAGFCKMIGPSVAAGWVARRRDWRNNLYALGTGVAAPPPAHHAPHARSVIVSIYCGNGSGIVSERGKVRALTADERTSVLACFGGVAP